MRLQCLSLLSVAILAIPAIPSHADTVTMYGPITLGTSSGIGDATLISGGNFVQLLFNGPTAGSKGYATGSSTYSFVYDIDPAYTAGVLINIPYDVYDLNYVPDAGRDLRFSITLCSLADVCTHAEEDNVAGIALPPLPALAVAGPGTGILQLDYAINDTSFSTSARVGVVNIYYEPVNPVPEPSTLAMLGTGLVGGIGAMRRRFAH